MFFASDNAGPVHPKVMERVIAANSDYAMPYGKDPIMDEVRAQIREQFEAPEAAVYLVATGTAANALALACYCQPWQTIFCSKVAHIEEDECNAPEFYSGAAKLTLVETDDKMTPDALRRAITARGLGDVHSPQRGPVSITQVTERGGVHSLDELQALTAVAKEHDLPVHMDGARFANALVALGCTPAEMTWKSGVDVVSFGGTKNGCMGVEAVVFFDPQKAWEFELRRKRGAHLFSKHRFLSAQMAGYLADGAWLETAKIANANAAHLAQGLRKAGVKFLHEPAANMIFARFPRAIHRKLHDAGARYYLWDGTLDGDDGEMLAARMVCDWSISRDQIDQFLSHF
ncbi:Low specificity L-threonine aldolase [Sulfitobacter indolifex]|uniref:L-threonine aldolase n=1 Tax=Sulfitobacter indolifex HEL-45 TaxID=391624 RepID=A0ABM9XBN3_9RHOB|nr:low specificity L-threonine aldolase [Sulfitobacter indolifex]EDQ06933.1 low-specificity L-threonine aldolase [Sulfitobacter indolifex HEL-45]UOA17915.1 Low specificity L-threonine aldolase [Sulfitobacter indolifex]